jgi:hypothetical protein
MLGPHSVQIPDPATDRRPFVTMLKRRGVRLHLRDILLRALWQICPERRFLHTPPAIPVSPRKLMLKKRRWAVEFKKMISRRCALTTKRWVNSACLSCL